jgi:hypothetical protein
MRAFVVLALSALALSAASPPPFVGVPFKPSSTTVHSAVCELGYTRLDNTDDGQATSGRGPACRRVSSGHCVRGSPLLAGLQKLVESCATTHSGW